MKAIMVMFDSLNRRFLEPYGCDETITPNFRRLAEHTVQFDNCYAGSLPCIPARRELHTGRYNFLHRSWGPLEPFDDSMPRMLHESGIHSHLVTDHGHYWECGGATYHSQYSTWEMIRGQEGDMWQAAVGGMEDPDPNFVKFSGLRDILYRQNLANRRAVKEKKDFPLVKTFQKGLEFLEENAEKDSWFLQIESFAPHEPFMASEEFKRMYPITEKGKKYEWPDYAPVTQSQEEIDQIKYSYFASLSMCDEQLGLILDFMDAHRMWEDTMLIVNTDHGYMLGEHGYWAKNYMPCYDEVVHIPLFIWDPRYKDCMGLRRKNLVQTIDLPVTLLDYFGIKKASDMQGQSVAPVLADDTQIHESILFGMFGSHICCTDGRYVYMRKPVDVNEPLYEYTLLPTHMMSFFSEKELKTMKWHKGFQFTKGIPVMQIETDSAFHCIDHREMLFDLEKDPLEHHPLASEQICIQMEEKLHKLLLDSEAPDSVLKRFDFL